MNRLPTMYIGKFVSRWLPYQESCLEYKPINDSYTLLYTIVNPEVAGGSTTDIPVVGVVTNASGDRFVVVWSLNIDNESILPSMDLMRIGSFDHLKINDKVFVRDDTGHTWTPAHFHRALSDKSNVALVFNYGKTSHTAYGNSISGSYKYIRCMDVNGKWETYENPYWSSGDVS